MVTTTPAKTDTDFHGLGAGVLRGRTLKQQSAPGEQQVRICPTRQRQLRQASSRASLLIGRGMPQMPQAFVRGHKAFDVATTMVVGLDWAPSEYGFEDVQQVRGTLQVGRVTGVMESN